jgi:hypothetical protein
MHTSNVQAIQGVGPKGPLISATYELVLSLQTYLGQLVGLGMIENVVIVDACRKWRGRTEKVGHVGGGNIGSLAIRIQGRRAG